MKNIVPTSTVNITGAGKTATAALYTLRLSTTKVFIYTSLLFKPLCDAGRFLLLAKPTVNIVNFTQTHYKISQQNYKKFSKRLKFRKTSADIINVRVTEPCAEAEITSAVFCKTNTK